MVGGPAELEGIWSVGAVSARGWYIKGGKVVVGGKIGGIWEFSL